MHAGTVCPTNKMSYLFATKYFGLQPENIDLFVEGQAFSQSYDLAPRPSIPVSLVVVTCHKARQATHRTTEKARQLSDGRGGKGVGEEQNYTTARKPSPL
jgi:hypothetical protein